MTRRRSPRIWCTLLLAVLIASAAGWPQEPEPSFGEAVDVRVVSIDVYVTDKKGRRVSGLHREDFRVYQDGRPVEVANFSRMTAAVPRPAPDAAVEPLEIADADDPLALIEEPLTVVIYIDNSVTTPPHRNRVLDDLRRFVVEQGRGVRFMVASFNPGLEVLVEPTQDTELVLAALSEIERLPARGLDAINDRRRAMHLVQEIYDVFAEATLSGQPSGIGPGGRAAAGGGPGGGNVLSQGGRGQDFDPCTDGWEQMIAAVDTYSQTASDRIGSSQSGLLGLVRSLGGVAGRKALLYMSDGLEQRPGIDLYAFLGELCGEREREMITHMTRWDETRLLEELADYANVHRVTLYALETMGLTSPSSASVEYASKRYVPSARNDALRTSNLQSSLFIMAEETGGQAFFNTNFPGAELARMAEDFREYYSLGFVPPNGWDGLTHRIRVELDSKAAKGATVRYRKRYRAIPDDERMAERTLATLVLGWQDNPLGTEIQIGEPEPAQEDTWEVPVEILLPREGLASRAADPGEKQLVRVVMIAEDARSRRTPMREKVIPIVYRETDGALSEESSRLVVKVELEPGVYKVAVGVRDELNQVASYHRQTVEVAPPETAPES